MKAVAEAQRKAEEERLNAVAEAQRKAEEEKAAAELQRKADEEKAAADLAAAAEAESQRKADEENAAAERQRDADAASKKEPPKPPGRRKYSIFVPSGEGDGDDTILELVEEDDDDGGIVGIGRGDGGGADAVELPDDGGGAAGDVQDGGGSNPNKRNIIQRGGKDPANLKIYKIKKLSPLVQDFMLSFKPVNEIFNDANLTSLIAEVKPMEGVEAIDEYNKIGKEKNLIPTNDTKDYFDPNGLGIKIAWKKSIIKLMNFLDKKPLVRTTENGKTYTDMYKILWNVTKRSKTIDDAFRSMFDSKKPSIADLSTMIIDIPTPFKFGRTIGWVSPATNSLFDLLFKNFSTCIDIKTISDFLDEKVSVSASADAYSFKLNWLILIAFHIWNEPPKNIYNEKKVKPSNDKNQILIDICELIEHLYKIFIGWVEAFKTRDSIINTFNPISEQGITYFKKTKTNIMDDTTDSTLKYLRKEIQKELCKRGTIEVISTSTQPARAKPSPRARVDLLKGQTDLTGALQPHPPDALQPPPPDLSLQSGADPVSPRTRARELLKTAYSKVPPLDLAKVTRPSIVTPSTQPVPLHITGSLSDRPNAGSLTIPRKSTAYSTKMPRPRPFLTTPRASGDIPLSSSPIKMKTESAEQSKSLLPAPSKPSGLSTGGQSTARLRQISGGPQGGGNKRHTRKKPRVARRAHHKTIRRLSASSSSQLKNPGNHKYTRKHIRKERQVSASDSV